jgi:hypothetical protein
MNTPKRGRRTKELIVEKVIVGKKPRIIFFPFTHDVLRKRKIVIYINNIKTFNIKVFKNIISLDIKSILNIHCYE